MTRWLVTTLSLLLIGMAVCASPTTRTGDSTTQVPRFDHPIIAFDHPIIATTGQDADALV